MNPFLSGVSIQFFADLHFEIILKKFVNLKLLLSRSLFYRLGKKANHSFSQKSRK